MKAIHLIPILFIFFIIMGSCGKSVNCDCIGEDPNIYIRIVSEEDSSDLVFGETRIYSPNQILAYTEK